MLLKLGNNSLFPGYYQLSRNSFLLINGSAKNSWETVMGVVLGALGIALAVACLGAFLSWRWRLLAKVLRGSEIAETALGPVEFARIGTGPVILQLHGGATGYDQTLALSWDVHEAGFTVLTPSRPGYLRTPLTTGA